MSIKQRIRPATQGLLGLILAAAFTGSACEDMFSGLSDGSDFSGGKKDHPSLALALDRASVSFPQGTDQTINVTIARQNFDGLVTLATTGLPNGVTASFSPSQLTAGQNAAVLTLHASSSANLVNNAETTVAANSAETQITAEEPLSITITSGTQPDFTLSTAGVLQVVQNATAVTTPVTITRVGNFTGGVNLTALLNGQPLPSGWTATFSPNPSTTGSSTLSLSASSAIAPGPYTITVSGTSGSLVHTTPISVAVAAAPDFAVTMSRSDLTTDRGGYDESLITLTRVGGYTGAVTYAISGLPSGATASFTPQTGSDNTMLRINTVSTTQTGSFPFVVTATGAGAPSTHVINGNLIVRAASAAVTVSNITVTAGSTQTAPVTLTRTNGFTGGLTLSVARTDGSALPTGMTVTLTPANPVTANAATVVVTTTAATPPGSYSFTLTASSGLTTVPDVKPTFTVTVNPPGQTGNVTWTFCDATRTPLFVAVRDGSTGAYQRVTSTSATSFNFNIASNVGSVAFVYSDGGFFTTEVFFMTRQELIDRAAAECQHYPSTGTRVLNGTVAGVAANEAVMISIGDQTTFVFPSAGSSFSISDLPSSAVDILAVRGSYDPNTERFTPNRYIMRRANTSTSGTTLPVFDFGSAEALAPTTAIYTFTNVPGTDPTAIGERLQTNTSYLSVYNGVLSTNPSKTVFGLTAASLQAGDLYQIFGGSRNDATGNEQGFIAFVSALADRSIALGAALNQPGVTVTTSGNLLLPAVTAPWQSDYGLAIEAIFQQSSRALEMFATRGYFGTAQNYTLLAPDLTGLTGYNTTWGLQNSAATQWWVYGYGGTLATTAGSTTLYAGKSGTIGLAGIGTASAFSGPTRARNRVARQRCSPAGGLAASCLLR